MSTNVLSDRTTDRLKDAHARRETDDYEALYAIVKALRAQGWTLQAIADPLDVSREIVRVWANRAAALDLPEVTVEAKSKQVAKATIEAEEVAARQVARDRREKAALEANLPRLLELKPDAEALRGPSHFDPSRAAASAEYTRLIDETLKAGVRGRILADALGVQQITLNARLRRSGLRKTAPSEKVPAWAKTNDWQTLVDDSRKGA